MSERNDTREVRAKAYLESKGLRWGRTPDDPQNVPTGELDRRPNKRLEWCVEFANAECAALEQENADLREQVNEWREASKTAVEITHIMEDDRRKLDAQIESLTAALAEALGELQKYQGVFGILPTLEDVENGITELL